MKKLCVLLVLASLSTSISALDLSLSAGGGALIGYTFTRYTLEGGTKDGGYLESSQNMDRINYGGHLFFDATYLAVSVLIQGGSNSYSENMIREASALKDSVGTGTELSLGFSLMGKYPFRINERITLFPQLGIEYQIALIQQRQPTGGLVYDRSKGELVEDRDKKDKPYPLYAWNAWWIDVGAGLEYALSNSLFLRGEVLFGFRLPTEYELGALEVVKSPPMNMRNPVLAGLTGSPVIKLAVGYRLR